MSKQEVDLTEAQTKLLESARVACVRAMEHAEKAEAAGLRILAGEWRYIARNLESAISSQVRAFRDGALSRETLKQKPFPFGKEE